MSLKYRTCVLLLSIPKLIQFCQNSLTPLTRAEYALHFPHKAGIEQLPAQGIDQLLGAQLQAALQAGELPSDTGLPALALTLMAIFFVTPILLEQGAGTDLKNTYHRQLQLVGIPRCRSSTALTT